jgi:cell division protein FtsB
MRKKIIGVVAIFLLMVLMMNINSRLTEYFRLAAERDTLRAQVTLDMATRVALETRVAYATSDQAVEDWARNDSHLSRPGDSVIVPLTPAGPTPEPEIKVTPTVRAAENWEVWWALFFGQ